MTQRHQFFCFIGSITNHQTLISSSNIKFVFLQMNWLGNIWTLTIHCYNNNCSFIIHSDFIGIITNLFDGLSGDLLEVNLSLSMNLSEDHTDGVLDCTFTCNFGVRILSETCVENGVRNVVTKFIGMTACNVFWGEEEMSRLYFVIHGKKLKNDINNYIVILFNAIKTSSWNLQRKCSEFIKISLHYQQENHPFSFSSNLEKFKVF